MNVWIESPFDNLPHEGFRKQRYWLLAEAFVAAGCRVTYWTSDFNHGTKARRNVRSCESPIDVHLVPTPPYAKNVSLARIVSHASYARRFYRLAKTWGSAGARRPDLIVAATPSLGSAYAALKLARHFGARFTLDVQDAWPETFYRLLPPTLAPLGRLLFYGMHRTARRLYREADLVTGVSARYAALTHRPDFYLAYHGYDGVCGESHPTQCPVRGESSATRLVYIGNLGAGYDLETVIEAVAREASLTLDIAGLGPKEPLLRQLANRLNLAERVRFHGYLGADDLRKLLVACDVGLIPMRDDSWVGLPYKLGDYLAAGLFVLSSLHGECGELLTGKHLGATYERGSVDSFLRAAFAFSPPATRARSALPSELVAPVIYPALAAHSLKPVLRRLMSVRRRAIPAEEKHAAEERTARELLAHPAVRRAIADRRPIAVYLAVRDEFSLAPFVTAAQRAGAFLAAPRWTGETYALAPLDPAHLRMGPHAIPEPDATGDVPPPAVWLVPGLAFSPSGDRLGYGGGWYDRLMAEASADALKIGVGFDVQVVPKLPREAHDVALTGITAKLRA